MNRTRASLKWLAALLAGLALQCQAFAGTVTYYHNDLAGSPVAATNEAGQRIWSESYRPYGERTINSQASSGNDVWFTSCRQDVETGLVYMGARYYDPVTGRFASVDPRGFDERNLHSHNRYAYANNNPYRFADPDGAQALPLVSPPPTVATTRPMGLQGKPSEAQQLRALEGFAPTGGRLRLPSYDSADVLNFVLGGFPAVLANKLDGLIFKAPEFQGGAITESGFLNAALRWLAPNPQSFEDGRHLSADGMRQLRFGDHETREGKQMHGHFEAYDKPGGTVIENTSVKITPDQ